MTIHAHDQTDAISTTHRPTDRELIDSSLARHSFLYAGEWQDGSFDRQRMHLVEAGRIAWSYELPRAGEYGDVSLLANGNILFAWYGGASEMTLSGETIWTFVAPERSEIHTCQPLDDERVFLVVNASPARALIMSRRTNEIEREVVIPTGGTNPHGMFRHCRFTADDTVLIAHMDLGKVSEYDFDGNETWSVMAQSPWAAVRLESGNTLISGDASGYVSEVDADGHVIWVFDREQARAQGYELFNVQQCARLRNGNTVLANWCSGDLPLDAQRGTAQLIEVDPGGRILWALSSWDDPYLGVASNFQILDDTAPSVDPMYQR